jgi:hypothetical protein
MAKPAMTGSSLLSKALQKAKELSPITIEVLISRSKNLPLPAGTLKLLWSNGSLSPEQIVVSVNPISKKAGVWIGPNVQCSLKPSEWQDWLRALEDDLHQTHPDRALALAVMSLSLALNSLHQR